MNNILTEKAYQHFIMDRLSQDNGYEIRKAVNYDRYFACDRELLFRKRQTYWRKKTPGPSGSGGRDDS